MASGLRSQIPTSAMGQHMSTPDPATSPNAARVRAAGVWNRNRAVLQPAWSSRRPAAVRMSAVTRTSVAPASPPRHNDLGPPAAEGHGSSASVLWSGKADQGAGPELDVFCCGGASGARVGCGGIGCGGSGDTGGVPGCGVDGGAGDPAVGRPVTTVGVALLVVCGSALALRRVRPLLAYTLAVGAAVAYLGSPHALAGHHRRAARRGRMAAAVGPDRTGRPHQRHRPPARQRRLRPAVGPVQHR